MVSPILRCGVMVRGKCPFITLTGVIACCEEDGLSPSIRSIRQGRHQRKIQHPSNRPNNKTRHGCGVLMSRFVCGQVAKLNARTVSRPVFFSCFTAVLVARFEFHSVQVICLSEQVMDNCTLSFDNHDHVTSSPMSSNTVIIHSTLGRQQIIHTMSVFIARSNRSNSKPISQHEARNLLLYSTVHINVESAVRIKPAATRNNTR